MEKIFILFFVNTSPFYLFFEQLDFIYPLHSYCLRGENYHRLHCVTFLNNLSFKMQIGDLNTCSQKQICFPSKNRTRFTTQCFPLSFITACNLATPQVWHVKWKRLSFLSKLRKNKIGHQNLNNKLLNSIMKDHNGSHTIKWLSSILAICF